MTTRGTVLDATLELVAEECCACGVLFAMSADFRRRRLNDHEFFYCPAGHQQHYTGKSEADKQRERADALAQRLRWAEAREDRQRLERQAAERSARAYRGHLTRIRKRIAAGVCPVAGCRRHFDNVEAHLRTQHEGWLHEHPEAVDGR